jgi:hypothetical protein
VKTWRLIYQEHGGPTLVRDHDGQDVPLQGYFVLEQATGAIVASTSRRDLRSELYIGTLRKFIEAMNGEFVLAARFDDGIEVPIRLTEAEDAA